MQLSCLLMRSESCEDFLNATLALHLSWGLKPCHAICLQVKSRHWRYEEFKKCMSFKDWSCKKKRSRQVTVFWGGVALVSFFAGELFSCDFFFWVGSPMSLRIISRSTDVADVAPGPPKRVGRLLKSHEAGFGCFFF